jgi:hypothetical protein
VLSFMLHGRLLLVHGPKCQPLFLQPHVMRGFSAVPALNSQTPRFELQDSLSVAAYCLSAEVSTDPSVHDNGFAHIAIISAKSSTHSFDPRVIRPGVERAATNKRKGSETVLQEGFRSKGQTFSFYPFCD